MVIATDRLSASVQFGGLDYVVASVENMQAAVQVCGRSSHVSIPGHNTTLAFSKASNWECLSSLIAAHDAGHSLQPTFCVF
jgi:hypothetical protein